MSRQRNRRGDWRGRADLLACVGGPLDGQWFYPGAWQTQVDAASYMAERMGERMGERPGPSRYTYTALGYERTEQTRPHPQHTETTGRVLAWREPSRRAASPSSPTVPEVELAERAAAGISCYVFRSVISFRLSFRHDRVTL